MRKTILTYGFISGAVAAVLMTGSAIYFQQSKDISNGAYFGYAGILLSMLFVFLGVRAYRDNVSEGSISFGKAFQVGILITVISCVCYVLAWMFVYKNIMPDFLEQYMRRTIEQMQQAGATADQINQHSQKMLEYKKMYQNPLTLFALTFLEPFPIGFLVTLISALTLRRQPSAP